MPFDPGSDYSGVGGSGGSFPGSVDPGVQAQDAQLGLSSKLAAIPVMLNKGASRQVLAMHGEPLDPTDITKIVRFDEALNSLNGMTSDEVESLQNQLYASGFFASSYYGKKPPTIVKGMVDAATSKAWENALLQSAKDQDAIQTTLSTRATQRAGAGLPTTILDPAEARPTINLTNPDDIRAAVVAAAKTELGHKVDEATINSIITRYQQMDAQAQNGSADLQATGGTVTAAPSVANYAKAQVTASNPTDAATHSGLGIGNLIMSAFMSSAGNAPTGSANG